MNRIRIAIAALLCSASARAETFEQQVLEASQRICGAALKARQERSTRMAFAVSEGPQRVSRWIYLVDFQNGYRTDGSRSGPPPETIEYLGSRGKDQASVPGALAHTA